MLYLQVYSFDGIYTKSGLWDATHKLLIISLIGDYSIIV